MGIMQYMYRMLRGTVTTGVFSVHYLPKVYCTCVEPANYVDKRNMTIDDIVYAFFELVVF
jgi:hypothetical protein